MMRDESKPVVKTLDSSLVLFASRDLNSAPLCRLPEGTEFQLGFATEFEGRQWFEARLQDGTSGYLLRPSIMGHTTAGAAKAARGQMSSLGDPEDAYGPEEPQVTILLVLVDAVILGAVAGLMMHTSDSWIGEIFRWMALVAVPLFGLVMNCLLCSAGRAGRGSAAWPIALIGPVLWVLSIFIVYFARGKRF